MKSEPPRLKIELTSDEKCIIKTVSPYIERKREERNNKPENVNNTNNNQSDFSYLNNSDILSISKTESSISENSSANHKDNSNLLVSFSNISEAENPIKKSIINTSSLSSSVIKKEKELTPSTLCNYYNHSNDNTPINKDKNIDLQNVQMNQCNLNSLYNVMNNSHTSNNTNGTNDIVNNRSASAKSKKTPIKYTKSQLKNEDEVEKKNLMCLFDETNIDESGGIFSNIEIKELQNNDRVDVGMCNEILMRNKNNFDNFQIESLNNVEILNKKEGYIASPNFSFDIKNGKNSSENSPCLSKNDSEYMSPKFSTAFPQNQDSNSPNNTNNSSKNTIAHSNNFTLGNCPQKHKKCIDSSSVGNKEKNKKNANITKKKNKPKSHSKENTIKNPMTNLTNKIYSILGTHLNFINKKSRSFSKKRENQGSGTKVSSSSKKNQAGNGTSNKPNTINFINNLRPLGILTNNDALKDLIKIRPKNSNSLTRLRNSSKNKKVTSLNRKNKIINISPKTNHISNVSNNNSSMYSENNLTKTIVTTTPNINTNTTVVNNITTTGKKQMKVIQDFSKYKKKSVLNNTTKRETAKRERVLTKENLMKKRPIMSKQINKVGGDQEPNFNFEEFELNS